MKHTIIITIMLFSLQLASQNPISPPGVYIADPTARVWKDGRLYIYGSADESCSYYCSHTYHMLVTDDMINWKVVKNVFSSKGENDEVPYNETLLFAPSAAYRDGTYFLYYCQPDREHAEGVATSDSPTGPFTGGTPMDVGPYNEIDPGVFIDGDGQAYYFWGQFTLKMAKLKDNMKELDMTTIRDSILTESEHFFHEGAFMAKIGDLYYLVYADISRGDIPTCIGYATATSPFGPYEYRGVIVDNNHCNPANWNNHGSIAEFNGQWYVFYHRSTHGCNKMRKAAVEPIEILPDGSIPEVEMTSQGAAGPIPATSQIDAAWACILNGHTRIAQHDTYAEGLTYIHSGDKAAYKYINFGEGVENITMRLKPGKSGGRIVVSLDKPWHRRLAILEVEPDNDGHWKELTFPVESAEGVHALWLHFYGEDREMFAIDWFRFD